MLLFIINNLLLEKLQHLECGGTFIDVYMEIR